MIALFFALVVIGALVVGYRISMYLYLNNAVEYSPRMMVQPESGMVEAYPAQPVREVSIMEGYHGLRYARIGILVIAGFVLLVAMVLIVVLLGII